MSTDEVSQVIANSILCVTKTRIEEILVKFSLALKEECNIDTDSLCNIWKNIYKESPDLGIAIKKQEKKSIKPDDGVTCEFVLGPKSVNAGTCCGELCKDSEPWNDGKHYCGKHKRQVSSRHSCEFIMGPKSKPEKRGLSCGSRIVKNSTIYSQEGEYEGHDYNGKWLCKKHTKQVTNAIDKLNNQCVHIFGEKSKNKGERCKSRATPGSDRCSKHPNGGKREKTQEKKKDDKKNALKKDQEKKEDKKKKLKRETKIIIDNNFEDKRNVEYIEKPIEFENGTNMVYVDKNSGMVCIEHEGSKWLLGIWNNEEQSFDPATKESIKYAKGHDIDPVPNDE